MPCLSPATNPARDVPSQGVKPPSWLETLRVDGTLNIMKQTRASCIRIELKRYLQQIQENVQDIVAECLSPATPSWHNGRGRCGESVITRINNLEALKVAELDQDIRHHITSAYHQCVARTCVTADHRHARSFNQQQAVPKDPKVNSFPKPKWLQNPYTNTFRQRRGSHLRALKTQKIL